ncbi:hypothetical protein K492DRAFT_206214 [Lichtheimia hyalospora FSU 10163]|nr:hypothetical protein K492DRAFT_206214 [Lichtheimia hyalospora FSU 10163]
MSSSKTTHIANGKEGGASLVIPNRSTSLHITHHQQQLSSATLQVPNPHHDVRPGWTLLRTHSAKSLDTLLSDLDRQREQCEKQDEGKSKKASSVHKLSQTLPKIFSRNSVAQYYNRAKNASTLSMRGKRPPLSTNASSQKPGTTCTTKEFNNDGTHQERKKMEDQDNVRSHVEPPSLLLPPSSRIHRVDSRVQIHQAMIHVQPSTASIEMVSHHQGDLQQGLDYFEKRDMVNATTAFKHASDSQVPAGMLLYGLALYHGWGCEACMPRGVKYVQQAIEYHVDIKCLTSTSTIMRAKIAMAMQAMGILFRAGWDQYSKQKDTANALFRMAQHLDPTQDTPPCSLDARHRNIRQSLGSHALKSSCSLLRQDGCRGDSRYPITRRMSI